MPEKNNYETFIDFISGTTVIECCIERQDFRELWMDTTKYVKTIAYTFAVEKDGKKYEVQIEAVKPYKLIHFPQGITFLGKANNTVITRTLIERRRTFSPIVSYYFSLLLAGPMEPYPYSIELIQWQKREYKEKSSE